MDARILGATGNDPSLVEVIIGALASMIVSFVRDSVEETCYGTIHSTVDRKDHT